MTTVVRDVDGAVRRHRGTSPHDAATDPHLRRTGCAGPGHSPGPGAVAATQARADGGDLRARDGRWFSDLADRDLPPVDHPVAGTIDPDDITDVMAYALIVAGAPVVLDSCGCGGGCGLDWFGPDGLARYAHGHPITRRKKDTLHWHVAREENTGDLHLVDTYSMRWLEEAPR